MMFLELALLQMEDLRTELGRPSIETCIWGVGFRGKVGPKLAFDVNTSREGKVLESFYKIKNPCAKIRNSFTVLVNRLPS